MIVTDCTKCPLHLSRTRIVNAIIPKGGCDVAVISGAPNRSEDFNGRINVGNPKKKLLEMLRNAGGDLERTAFIPLVRCRGKNDRQPTSEEITACRPYLLADLKEANPQLVVTLGVGPYEALAHEEGSLTARRADVQLPWDDSEMPYPMMGTFAPGTPFREWDKQEVIEGDLDKALTYAATKPHVGLGNYRTILDPVEAADILAELKNSEWVSFDFETESLGMWSDWEILTMQVCGKAGEAYTFPLRGAWARYEEDYYPSWQQEKGTWAFTAPKKGEDPLLFQPRRVLRKDDTKSHSIMKPAFPKGSIVCRYPERHDHEGEHYEAAHTCRGTITNVLGGEPVVYDGPGQMHGKVVPADWVLMRDVLANFLESPVKKFGQNIKFDVHAAIYQLGVRPRNIAFDTMLAYHLIHEEFFANNGLDLDAIRARVLFMPRYNLELKEYVPGKKHSFAEIPNDVLWSYGGADADCEFQLREPLISAIKQDNPDDGMWLLENIALPLQRTLTQIEQRGILINRARLDELSQFYREKIADTKHQLDTMCKERNLTPPAKWTNERQLRAFIFEKHYDWVVKKATLSQDAITTPMRGLGMPKSVGVLSKKTGALSTGKKSITALQAYCRETVVYKANPDRINPTKIWRNPTTAPLSARTMKERAWRGEMVGLIGKLRSCVNQKNLFLDGDDEKKILGAKALLRHIRADGRVHPSYRQTLETARLSAQDPNSQNIANTSEDTEFMDMGIRSMYTVPEGHDWTAVDYSSEEVRVMAYLAEDEELLEKLHTCDTCGEIFLPTEEDPNRPLKMHIHCRENDHLPVDIHRYVASRVYNKPEAEVTKGERLACKRVTFGLAYGQGPTGLADLLGWEVSHAKALIEDYFKTFPKLRKYQDRINALVKRGYDIPNAFGRFRHTNGVIEMKGFTEKELYKAKLAAAQRERLNFTVQSPSAEILSLCTIALGDVWGVEDGQISEAHRVGYELLGFYPSMRLHELGAHIVASNHDALEFESPTENRAEVHAIIEKVMVGLPWVLLKWLLPVDIQVGRFWEEKGDDDESS